MGVRPAVNGSAHLTSAFKEGTELREGGGRAGGQEPGCAARADYAYCEAAFLDVVFVLEPVAPGRCCK